MLLFLQMETKHVTYSRRVAVDFIIRYRANAVCIFLGSLSWRVHILSSYAFESMMTIKQPNRWVVVIVLAMVGKFSVTSAMVHHYLSLEIRKPASRDWWWMET